MTVSLTSVERVRRMFARQDHDRVPRHDYFWPETIARWQREGFAGGVVEAYIALGSDFRWIGFSSPVPFPGRHEVIREDQQTQWVRGPEGKIERVWKDRSGTPEHVSFDCDSREKWEAVYKPALLKADRSANVTAGAAALAAGRQANMFNCLCGLEAFESMRQLAGDEILLSAMALEPEWVLDMATTYTDLILADFAAILERHGESRADAVWVFGDIGYKNGPFFSPQMYRDLIWPQHCRMCRWAHERGMNFIYHTDGDVRSLMDIFVEGSFDALQPLEAKAGMNVIDLAPRYGRQLAFIGNIDMTVASTNDLARVEHELRTKLEAGMAQRGYCYYSDHSVPPQVSWDTYRFIIELLDRHGRY
ncbi:MAG: hypothetical protein IT440_01165 [Phycisphaeraceae bacterium]|nr:hypothetical protein [Phycisphaeraceae bacterium]